MTSRQSASAGLSLAVALAAAYAVAAALPGAVAASETNVSVTGTSVQASPAAPRAVVPSPAPDSLGPLLAGAQRLMAANRPAEALVLLERETPTWAGHPDFDFQLGIAALDAGHSGKAIFALERVLAVQPGNSVARAEIARAFMVASEHDAARREFEAVRATDLPEPVRKTVDRYLAILTAPEDTRQARFSAQLELALGYDDNVNLGTSLDRWVIGDGQALTPLAASRPRKSTFQTLGVSGQYIVPIGGSADWTIGVAANQRINPSQHNYDLGAVDLTTGFGWVAGLNRYSVSAQLQQLWLDQESFRRAAGLSAQWQHDLGTASQVGLYAQWFALRFPDQEIRNARRQVVGATLAHGFGDSASTVGIANLYVGREQSTEEVDELGFDLRGLRVGLSRSLSTGLRASASFGWEERRHEAPDSFFGVTREDRQLEWRVGLDHALATRLTVSPLVSHLRNRSTLGPNEFRRTQVQVGLRYRY